jgi:hypothetical protein
MHTLQLPKPISAGIRLSYQDPGTCKHGMYACSPTWESSWIALQDLECILAQHSTTIQGNPRARTATHLKLAS